MTEKDQIKTRRLVLNPPTKKDRGYLKRAKKGLYFKKEMAKENPDPEIVDEMIEFLADYVEKPEDRDEAIELFWNATEEEIDMMIEAVTGQTKDGEDAEEKSVPKE